MSPDFDFSFLQSGLRKWPIIDSMTLNVVYRGLKQSILCFFCVSRMSSPCCISAVLLVFMALAVGARAEQSEQSGERSCDVIGDKSSESQMERALLKKLEPLSQMRYSTTPRRPQGCTVPTLSPREGEDLGPDHRTGVPISMVCDWLPGLECLLL